jgi:hypothetical protein
MPTISFEEQPAPLSITQDNQDPSGVAALKPKASNFGDPAAHDEPSMPTDKSVVQKKATDGQEIEPSSEESQKNNREEKEPTENKMEQLSLINENEAHPINTTPKKKRTKKMPTQVQSQIYGADIQTRSITFADIAKGFIYSLRDEGNDWLKRDGDDSKHPDPVEMRYISYIQKVVWYLQNSFRQSEPKSWPDMQASMSFKITLNKDGEIVHIETLKPSGNDLLDAFTHRRIQNAGPFPPLPDHFKRDFFQILLSFTVGDRRMPIIHGYIACM